MNLLYRLKLILLTGTLGLSGCDGFCVLGLCFMDSLEVAERSYDPVNGSYVIAGDLDGEYNWHSFKMSDEQTIEKLSFGVLDADSFRQYTGIKKIHILTDRALETYRREYLIPRKVCPASFINQNLQSLVLLPLNEGVEAELEAFDIPFDAEGTPFKLTGHYLQHDQSYFIKDGARVGLEIIKHESVMSNVGSARHKVHYFLVTRLEP